jgi:mRNA-degrading endonuclease RelE of RelBE toxin-antitoxin system
MEFIEAPAFTKHLSEYLSDDDFKELQSLLRLNPEAGDVIQGTGGFRKVRWTDRRRGKGKRGGLRIIYFYFQAEEQIWLLTIYGKDEAEDLTAEQKRMLKAAIEEEKRARLLKKIRRRL